MEIIGIELNRIVSGLPHSPIVYFIKVGDRVKIGTTTNLLKRLDALSLTLTEVVRVIPGGIEVESVLHERFTEHRIHDNREWFYLRGNLHAFLKRDHGNLTIRTFRPRVIRDGYVVGMTDGAERVGLSVEAFKKRRQRAGGTLPGETRQGNQPAWTAGDLDAWRESWPRVVAASGE